MKIAAPGTYRPDALHSLRGGQIKVRKEYFLLQLAILEVIRPKGVHLTQRLIADVCGCSNTLIYLITTQALDKMQREAQRRQLMEDGL
jgi:hypothetical protein